MRKIGILTFHSAENYGAVLQAYALQKYLQKKYPEDEINIINFKTDLQIQEYSIFKKLSSSLIKNLAMQLLTIFRYIGLKKRKNRFHRFVNEKLSLTPRYFSEKDLLTNIAPMDIYINGSDQVFNPNNKYLRAYFMDFENKNTFKIAYAPSFGISNFTQIDRMKVESYLKEFDALSCRETIGADFISNIIGKFIPTVCDPVFLLNKEEWSKIAIVPSTKSKYIFVYDLNGGKCLIDIANKIKSATGYKIICQTQTIQRFYNVDQQIYDSGPLEFIGLISNAEYIITDSFHGTAFSIIMGRRFYSYIAIPNSSSRIRSILNLLNLDDQIIEHGKSNEFIFLPNECDNYEYKLNEFISYSKDFLKKHLN